MQRHSNHTCGAEMSNESPCTPTKEHHISSPIWDCSITVIEAFLSDNSGEEYSIHACIERLSSNLTSGLWSTHVAVPGTTETETVYTTEDIKRMIDNNPAAPEARRASRMATRRKASRYIHQADVRSVRVRYNDFHMFLDRDERERNHWSRGSFHLTTAQIKSILSFEGS